MSEIYTQLMEERKRVSKRDRDTVVACVAYKCSKCEITGLFDVCVGVFDPKDYSPGDHGVPLPHSVPCLMCDGEMVQGGEVSALPDREPKILPRFRVPSRRAAVHLARANLFQAQLVHRSEP